ncbi:hypothetical protein [Burkholderia sp. MSMB1072]|uniref:hypothetical protein n=1 Tax=Burkholderia sp. MSMB1072 TaxID=1637871 RepID=UPI00211DA3BA|nr:hypothetical protein [Burkholderia sp. MSMB1072]
MDHSLGCWTRGNKVGKMTAFSIDFVNDMEHEHLMAEVSFEGQRLCVIDKEAGNDKMKIEFLVDLYMLPDSVKMKFNLDEFLKILATAKTELAQCA